MKKLFALAAASLFVSGIGFAQGSYQQNQGNSNAVSGTETITVTIPKRTALHIQESTWVLDLSSTGQGSSFKPYVSAEGQGCFMIPKHVAKPTTYNGVLGATVGATKNYPLAVYPAVQLENGDVKKEGNNYLKGGLVCFNRKIVQKFSNASGGYKFDVSITSSGSAKPGLVGLADYVATGPNTFSTTASGSVAGYPGNGTPVTGTLLNVANATTGGFLDDRIDEFIYFDGTETAGSATIQVQFTLTGL